MQDAFFIVAVWRRTSIHSNVRERLAETYSEAMSSITINNLINCSFFIISYFATSFKVIQIFCVYITISLLIIYILQLTMFGSFLAVFGHIERKNLHSLICVPIISKSGSGNKRWIFQAFCSGGINIKDPDNTLDNQTHYLMQFFRDGFAKLINNPFLKAMILLTFAVHLIITILNISHFNEGLNQINLFDEESYARKFVDNDQTYFLDNKYPIHVVINETLDYSNSIDQFRVEKLISRVENSDYMTGQTQCWLRSFIKFVRTIKQQGIHSTFLAKYNLTEKKDFYSVLKNVFLPMPSNLIYKSDIIFNENMTDIISSRCIVFSGHLINSSDEREMLDKLYMIADTSKLNVTFYNHHFGLFEQYSQTRTLIINILILLVIIVAVNCLIFMPIFKNIISLILITISIELGFINYLTIWNINLDFITLLILIMNIVFSTNCLIHISYTYSESTNYNSKKKRIRNTLFTIGFPLVQNYFLKLVIVASIALSSFSYLSINYIFSTFVKSSLILITLCAYHELLILPILLSIYTSLFKKSIHLSDKHLHDIEDEDSEDDFSRKVRKSYYKCNIRQRLDDLPFYHTEKWFVDSKLYHSNQIFPGISELTINSRTENMNLPRLIINQSKDNKLNDSVDLSIISDTKLSDTFVEKEMRDKNNQNVIASNDCHLTIWDNDENIRKNVISRFNEHWRHINSKKNSRQPNHQCGSKNSNNVIKSPTGLSVQTSESTDLGLNLLHEENLKGSWKLNKESLFNSLDKKHKMGKTNRCGIYLDSENSEISQPQITYFRALPPIPDKNHKNTINANTLHRKNKYKSKKTTKNNKMQIIRSLKEPIIISGIPGASSFLADHSNIKKKKLIKIG